ncbi:hypothetical protein N9D23_05140 [Rubripirellula sp.]|nr:hypothetical protein [Rubripirellula sp.]
MTSTPTLADLRSLWTAPPSVADPGPTITEPAKPPRCWHRDRAAWIDKPDRSRRGWIRTTCELCEGFVGYRRIDEGPKKRRKGDA